jgi:hypothetical protein
VIDQVHAPRHQQQCADRVFRHRLGIHTWHVGHGYRLGAGASTGIMSRPTA